MRTGRTGRFGRKGCSVIFVHDARSKSDVNEIMAELGKPMKKIDATRSTDLEQLEKVIQVSSTWYYDCKKSSSHLRSWN